MWWTLVASYLKNPSRSWSIIKLTQKYTVIWHLIPWCNLNLSQGQYLLITTHHLTLVNPTWGWIVTQQTRICNSRKNRQISRQEQCLPKVWQLTHFYCLVFLQRYKEMLLKQTNYKLKNKLLKYSLYFIWLLKLSTLFFKIFHAK